METNLVDYLSNLQLGEVQTFENMTIIPIFVSEDSDMEYISLSQALEQGLVTITEVDQSGSVPNLKVINNSEQWVLLLDGEEIVGAKQNRTLNTSILIDKQSELVIPVSCTEQGRWQYTSREFSHSNAIMSQRARMMKSHSVYRSLLAGSGHRADQYQVWSDVAELHRRAGSSSQTQAMKDVYTAKSEELDTYLQAFESMPNQQGCLVFVNGKLMGLDVISKADIYKQVHSQLIKSYAMEAILGKKEPSQSVTKAKGQAFFEKVKKSKEQQFEGVGLGKDYRYEIEDVFGSALIFNNQVLHLAFFKNLEIRDE
jgi:ARG and Rhodanese-Phosphatase-superfamily-associated Protein domain/ARPP-2